MHPYLRYHSSRAVFDSQNWVKKKPRFTYFTYARMSVEKYDEVKPGERKIDRNNKQDQRLSTSAGKRRFSREYTTTRGLLVSDVREMV